MTQDDDAPYVCPGCYAVGGERCAPGCIDDEMAREVEEGRGRRYPCSACGDLECPYTWADECPGRDLGVMLQSGEEQKP